MSKAEELAEKEVEKRISKSIASRIMKVRRLKAQIKEIEKEIKKIIDGDLVPAEEDDDSSDSGFRLTPGIFDKSWRKRAIDLKGYDDSENWPRPTIVGPIRRGMRY